MDKTNLVIIGGGIIGITIAREAAHNKLFSNITVIEKETNLGIHASTRNSGVIHAGFYYSPDSFKAKFCVEGNKLMREYCIKKNLLINKCGKVVVTSNENDEITLKELYKRGKENGSKLYLFAKDKLFKYEPLAKTYDNFLWSPNTWSICPNELFRSLLNECEALGINFITDQNIVNVTSSEIITSKGNTFSFDYVVNCAGGYSLEVAKLFGLLTNYKVLPFKGLYLRSKSKIKDFKRHIYPVPDINQPFLGIHTTLTSDNYLKLGPTAIPVLSPENYSLFEGLDWNISREVLLLQLDLFWNNKFEFRDLAFREIKYLIKNNIIDKAKELTIQNLDKIQFEWYSPGIRPQLFNIKTNKLENDFVLLNNANSIHILNSISPAWTCAFKNANYIIEKIKTLI